MVLLLQNHPHFLEIETGFTELLVSSCRKRNSNFSHTSRNSVWFQHTFHKLCNYDMDILLKSEYCDDLDENNHHKQEKFHKDSNCEIFINGLTSSIVSQISPIFLKRVEQRHAHIRTPYLGSIFIRLLTHNSRDALWNGRRKRRSKGGEGDQQWSFKLPACFAISVFVVQSCPEAESGQLAAAAPAPWWKFLIGLVVVVAWEENGQPGVLRLRCFGGCSQRRH